MVFDKYVSVEKQHDSFFMRLHLTEPYLTYYEFKDTSFSIKNLDIERELWKYMSLILPNQQLTFRTEMVYDRKFEKHKKRYALFALVQDSAEVRRDFLNGSISEKEFPDAKIFHGTLYSNKVPLVFKKDK